MLSKYEEFKIASIILGQSMKQLAKAESGEIRETCLDSRSNPDVNRRIDEAIQQAEKKWTGFYYSNHKLTANQQ